MGINSRKAPPLPAPTEESTTPSELEPTPTDVSSRPGDEKSTYSLPEDGSPVTIKTRGKNNQQTSLLIEYSDNHRAGKPGAEADRRPSVRVRVTTPSGKGKNGGGRIKITEAADLPSYTRRAPISPLAPSQSAPFRDGEDDQSIGSYASATEESNVSRNQPIDIGIDIGRAGRRRRPASPLIPQEADDTMGSLLPSTQSEISAIPTDSFLDGSGPTRSSEGKWASSPNSAEKLRNAKTRTVSRERVKISSSDKKERSDRKHKSGRSRTSSASDKYGDEPKSSRRRSSRNHEPAVSAVESSAVSSNFSPSHRSMDQHSMRSESSSKSINNPKLLEAVEDAIRRLILPQLDSLRRETSMRESARRGSVVSTGTSISREDLLADRRQPSDRSRDPRYKNRRDREGRHDYADASPRDFDRESVDGSSLLSVEPQTPRRKSGDAFKAAAAATAVGGLTAAALAGSPSDEKKQRRRKRAESVRSRSIVSDAYTDDFDDDDHLAPAPPMPLMSEINPSEVTRTSILSADTDRPHSATEEASAAVREVIRPVGSTESSTPTLTKTPNIGQDGLGIQHANVSHGDLTALRSKRDSDTPDHHVAYTRVSPPMDDPAMDDLHDIPPDSTYMASAYDYYNTQDVPPPLRYEPYQPERRGLSPIYSVSGYTEAGSDGPQHRDSRTFAPNESDSPEKTSQRDVSMKSPASAHSNVMGRESDLKSDDRSSFADYRNSTSVNGSDLDLSASRQAVQGIGANPDIVDVPVGLESHVASLIDGSMVDQSVLSGPRDSTISYGDGSRSYVDDRSSPTKQSTDSRQYADNERASTPTARSDPQRSREFTEEYDLDKYGRKILKSQYRQSPTDSEAAITAGAAAKAIKALKANQGRQPTAEGESDEAFVPAGVQRNRSFKERTLAGHELATTPTHSVDRLDYEDQAPKMGATGLPDLDDPMPEIGYVDESDTHTNASVVKERLDGVDDHTAWANRSLQTTPKPHEMTRKGTYPESEERHGLGITETATAAALGAAAAMAASHSRQPSNDRDEDWQRTSDERKRDTLGTNPFEGISPVANPQLGDNLYGGANYGIGFHTGSPGGPLEDEGYKSQGPNRTPDFQAKEDDMSVPKAIQLRDGADPFYETPKPGHTRHLSGMSHGMTTPFYDAATGGGIDRIESKDIVALMQEV